MRLNGGGQIKKQRGGGSLRVCVVCLQACECTRGSYELSS